MNMTECEFAKSNTKKRINFFGARTRAKVRDRKWEEIAGSGSPIPSNIGEKSKGWWRENVKSHRRWLAAAKNEKLWNVGNEMVGEWVEEAGVCCIEKKKKDVDLGFLLDYDPFVRWVRLNKKGKWII